MRFLIRHLVVDWTTKHSQAFQHQQHSHAAVVKDEQSVMEVLGEPGTESVSAKEGQVQQIQRKQCITDILSQVKQKHVSETLLNLNHKNIEKK